MNSIAVGVICFFIGVFTGFFMFALCNAASINDRSYDEEELKEAHKLEDEEN